MTRFTSRVFQGGTFPLASKAELRAIAKRLDKAAECVLRDFEWVSAEEQTRIAWSVVHSALQGLANQAWLQAEAP